MYYARRVWRRESDECVAVIFVNFSTVRQILQREVAAHSTFTISAGAKKCRVANVLCARMRGRTFCPPRIVHSNFPKTCKYKKCECFMRPLARLCPRIVHLQFFMGRRTGICECSMRAHALRRARIGIRRF